MSAHGGAGGGVLFWRKGAESRDTPHSLSEDPRRVAGRLRGKDWLKVTQGGAGELGCALGPAQPRRLLPLRVLPGCPPLQDGALGAWGRAALRLPAGEIKSSCLELMGREPASPLIALIPVFTNCQCPRAPVWLTGKSIKPLVSRRFPLGWLLCRVGVKWAEG